MNGERLNSVLRKGRAIAYKFIDPSDALFLRINRMRQYPPISLRRHVSCLGFLDGSGYEYVAFLRLLAGLSDGAKVLDMACGCGFLELALESHKWRGEVIGVDIHRPSIQWCMKTISRRNPSFRFVHADIFNAAYWRKGRLSAAQWFEQFEEAEFDCVVAKSLFTHMLPEELPVYLSHLASLSRIGGRSLFSFFLLNQEQKELQLAGQASLSFSKIVASDVYGVRSSKAPTAAVAYEEDHIESVMIDCGWKPVTKHYGYWSGRPNALHYQDLIVATRQ